MKYHYANHRETLVDHIEPILDLTHDQTHVFARTPGGTLVDRVTPELLLRSGAIRNLRVEGMAVFDDGRSYFIQDEQSYENPSELLHVAVRYDILHPNGRNNPDPFKRNKEGQTNVLLFNKDLTLYQHVMGFEDVMSRAKEHIAYTVRLKE